MTSLSKYHKVYVVENVKIIERKLSGIFNISSEADIYKGTKWLKLFFVTASAYDKTVWLQDEQMGRDAWKDSERDFWHF